MIKFASENIKFLEKISAVPVLKYFFVLKISANFQKIDSEPVLKKFYTDIYVNDKTSKKTEKNRFDDLNETSLNYIKKQKNPVIHDIAVSNGISSSELSGKLKTGNIKNEFYISDKFAEIFVKKGFITKIYDSDKNLMFAYIGFLFAADKNIFFPLTVLLFKLLKKTKIPVNFDYKLLLFHPETLKKIKTGELRYINYDVFNTVIKDKFTFVRVMNILNLGYFNRQKIKPALENIKKSMKENAILLIGRTNADGINNAGFYKKNNNKLILLEDVNEGSEINSIIG
ncbi:MAG: hypothetical protein GXO50_09860 [Chlorobi bacterium]|nr:hypothetical protein [Chlorobiota bacterium]